MSEGDGEILQGIKVNKVIQAYGLVRKLCQQLVRVSWLGICEKMIRDENMLEVSFICFCQVSQGVDEIQLYEWNSARFDAFMLAVVEWMVMLE